MSAKKAPVVQKPRAKEDARRAPKAGPSATARVSHAALATLSGVLVFLSFPNFSGWEVFPVQWFSLVPLLFVLRTKTAVGSFLWGLLTGTVTNVGGFYWISGMLQDFGHLPLWIAAPLTVVMAAYQGLIFALWALGTHLAHRRAGVPLLLAAPVVFVVVELLLPFIFPWYFANGQVRFLAIIQMTDITGVAGLSFLLVLVNVALFLLAEAALARRKLPTRQAAVAFVVFLLAVAYGLVRIAQVDAAQAAATKLRIGLVEANIGIWEKEARSLSPELQAPTLLHNLVLHQRLSADLAARGAELIVWPESSYIPLRDIALKRTDLFGVAVGDGGQLLERRDRQWLAPATTLPAELGGRRLLSAAAATEQRVLAVGEGGLGLAWDGKTWSALPTGTSRTLRAVWAERGQNPSRAKRERGWAVGDGGAIVAFEDGAFRVQSPGTDGAPALRGVAGRSFEAAVAVGDGGAIWQAEAGELRRVTTSAGGAHLRAVWVAWDEALSVAVGDAGNIAVRKGLGGWTAERVPGAGNLRGVWGRNAREVYVVGDGGLIARFDGTRWATERSGTAIDLLSVSGDEAGHVYAVGEGGAVLEREDDGSWTRAETPTRAQLRGVAAVGYVLDNNIPHDVRYFYQSPEPLPKVEANTGEETVVAEWAADRPLPLRDRNAVQRGFQTPLLFGAITVETNPADPEGRPFIFNTAILIDDRGKVLGLYDKNYLLVFGEYIPFGDWFPVFYDWLPEAGHFAPGRTVETFPFSGAQIGVMICYEDILPRFTARLADKDPNVIINVTNDAWFGKTAEPWLHLTLAMFRAVENRLWLIRSTNTGVSAYVDATGRLLSASDLEREETLLMEVPLLSLGSVYRTVGDVFAWACVLVLILFVIYGFAGRTEQRRKGRRRR